MVVDESITNSLNRIAENQEEMIDVLKRIADHYDGVVPVMTRNAKRVEKAHEEDENSPYTLRNIFKSKNTEPYDEFGVNTHNSFKTEPKS